MKKTTLILAVVFISLLVSLAPMSVVQVADAPVIAQAQDPYGLDVAATQSGIPKTTNFPYAIGSILFMAISMIGVLFLVLVVYGGFLWMTAGGNPEKTKKAGAIMRNGAIGVLIVLSAAAITHFVIIDLIAGLSAPPPPPPSPGP